MDEKLKVRTSVVYERDEDGNDNPVATGRVFNEVTVVHATQTEFLPLLALPRSLAGKRVALVVLDDE